MKPKYDKSTKPYEILIQEYTFADRILQFFHRWYHWKYYNSEQACIDAIRAYRNSKWANIKVDKTIRLKRFKYIKREL